MTNFSVLGATDPCNKACIAIDGLYDVAPLQLSFWSPSCWLARSQMRDIADACIPPAFWKAWDVLDDRLLDRRVRLLGKADLRTRFEFNHARFALGLPTYAEATKESEKFSARRWQGSIWNVSSVLSS